MDTLMEAYRTAKANDGSGGVDGQTFEDIEKEGLEKFLQETQQELIQESYEPQTNRQVEIPKGDGKKMRQLSIPVIRDRVVQGAIKLILESIFEADFCDNTFGYRPKRSCAQTMHRVTGAVMKYRLTQIVDVDLSDYFSKIRHHILLAQVAKRINDGKVMKLLKQILKVQGKIGVPQGGPLSTLLANLYMADVDRVFENAEGKTQVEGRPRVQYTRYVDDIVIAVGEHPRWPNLKGHCLRRLREELDKLEIKINEEKTKAIDLLKGESFTYLGFDCKLLTSPKGKKFLLRTPRLKKRKEILEKIRQVIQKSGKRTAKALIQKINPILAGWVNYFRMGHATRTFQYVEVYVKSRVRRFAMRRRLRRGFGYKRWSDQVIYGEWGLFHDYKIRYYLPPDHRTLFPIGV
jgi:RNA-directed DNA polymerase